MHRIGEAEFRVLWAWIVDSWAWMDAAELCLESQRRAAEVAP